MGFLNFFRRQKATGEAGLRPNAQATGVEFSGFDDPAFLEFIRSGTLSGGAGTRYLRNMATLRCVMLISNGLGMLPLNLYHAGEAKKLATEHMGYQLLKRRPNDWLTPMEFKSLMQLRALIFGNAYARVIWSMGRPISLIPMDPLSVEPKLNDRFQMVYEYTNDNGRRVTLPAREVFHLKDISVDGVKGISRLSLGSGALELAKLAELAAGRVFKTGVMAGGAIEVENSLSEPAYQRMKDSVNTGYSGAENAGKWFLLEEGAKANKFTTTAADAQQIENRKHQIEEVARLFGVPRPLLMMDDTSWGSGIEQLAIFYVQYTLAPWFVAWEQALARVLLPGAQIEDYQFKFNEGALLRGTLNDQANFFAKALGAGGQAPWMTQNEVREISDLPVSDDPMANQLRNQMTQKGNTNEPDSNTAGN